MRRTPDILVRLSIFLGYFRIEKFILSWPVQAKSDRLLAAINSKLKTSRTPCAVAQLPDRDTPLLEHASLTAQ